MTNGSSKVFLREATGLVREFSALDLFLYNLSNSAIGVTIAILPGILSGLFPAANITSTILLGGLLAWSSGWMFLVLSVVMPRSGGDYVFNTRLLHPVVGFVSNWIFLVSFVFDLAVFSSWVSDFGLADGFLNYGFATGNSVAKTWGTLLATPTYTFVIGAISLVLLGFILLGGPRYGKHFYRIGFIPAVVGLIVAFGVLASSTNSTFVAAFNKFMIPYSHQPDSYHYVIGLASKLGYTIGGTNLSVTIFAGVWSSILLYIGYQFSSYMGGEVKRVGRAQPIAIIAALVVTAISLVVVAGLYYRVVGPTFQNSLTYVTSNYPGNFSLPVSATSNFFAGLLTTNPVLIAIMSIGFVSWFVMLVYAIWLPITRSLFAWSFDRMLPNAFARIYQRTGAPWFVIFVTGIVAIVFLYVYSFSPGVGGYVNVTLLYTLLFFITGFSAAILPWRKKELYQSAPAIARWKIGPAPLVSIAGVVNVILYGALFYLAILYPTISGPISPSVFELIGFAIVAGVVLFYVARAARRRQGIQVDLAFREIPPE